MTILETRPSASSDLWGSQSPRFASVPPSAASLGDQAVAFAAKAGLFLDPWQQDVLRGSMGLKQGGKWAARNVGLLVPRQNGKGSILEARELFGMFVLHEPLIIHSAHRFDTSQEHFLRMRNLIDGNDDLARHVKSVFTANGKESIELKDGCRLKFKARTLAGSGRGFSCDTLVLDEAMLLPEQALSAMGPAQSARRNPQTWFTSSAGTPESAALWRLVKQGREKAKRLAYFEWGCEQGIDLSEFDRIVQHLADANPGLGYRLTLEELENEFGLLSPDDFCREHMGVWDDQAKVAVLPGWESLNDAASEIVGPPMYAIAVADDRSWSCVAGAGNGPVGAHVEVGEYRAGTGWVVARATDLKAKYGSAVFMVRSNGAAGSLIGDLENANVPVVKVSQQEYAQACGDFYDAVVDCELRHSGQGELDAAVGGALKKPVGDAFVWDPRKSSLDISPLEAATLAYRGHVTQAAAAPNIW